MNTEESLNNAENLLARLEAARVRLEQTEDPDGVPVNLLIGCYVPAVGDTGRR